MNPLISIIVPVYNVEKYLARCVESLINQSYKNLEIILVDDGSTDKSSNMCDEFEILDNRIKVIHKKNGGLSDARNVAVQLAAGQYIMCVDSDDHIEKNTTKILYDSMVATKSDIATCSYSICYENTNNLDYPGNNNQHVMDTSEALETMMYQKHTTHSAWGKLYKKSLFKDTKYPVGKNYEDLATTYKIFSRADKVVFNSYEGYSYLQREGSIINEPFKADRMDALSFAETQCKFIKQNYPSAYKAAKNRLFVEAVYIALEIPKSVKKYEKYSAVCNAKMKKYSFAVLTDSNSKLIIRLYASIALISPSFLTRLLKIRRQSKNKMKQSRITA